MNHPYLKKILDLCEAAGRIAMDKIDQSIPSLKPDQSVLTIADREISILIRRELQDIFKSSDHFLIDEEDEQRTNALSADFFEKKPLIWVVDPIDGTRVYANKVRHFAISIGLLKELQPWLGAVYFPALSELFFSDGQAAYFVENAFSQAERKTEIRPIDQEITSQSIFYVTDNFSKRFEWDYKDCHIMIPSCAAADLCWPTIGRGCGAITKSYLWDFAGSWPIFEKAGLSFRSLETGKVLSHLHCQAFNWDRKPWLLSEHYILSSAKNFPILKSKITKKSVKL